MSKKSFIILIVIAILLGLIILGIVFFLNIKKNNGGQNPSLRDFFPFGKIGSIISPPTNTEVPPPNTTPIETPTTKIPRLRKVSENPVAGYTLTTKEVPVDPNNVPKPKEIVITPTYTFTKDLSLGIRSAEVTELQKILNQCPQTIVAETGVGSLGKEGTLFNTITQKAVIAFQEKFSDDILKPQEKTTGTGILDELTRKKLSVPFTCTEKLEVPKTIIRDVVRFVEKGNSNIYDAFTNTLERTRLSNTTIPRVQEAFFGNAGASVIMRYLQNDNMTIETYLGKVPEPVLGGDSLPELTGKLIQQNISDISVSPDGTQFLYLIPSGGQLLGFISDFNDGSQRKIFNSQFNGWLSQWATDSNIIFTIKATGYAKGFAYSIDLQKGGFSKIVGSVSGLTTLVSPNGKYVLYSQSTKNGILLNILNTETKVVKNTQLPTLPEKCVWNKTSTTIYCSVPSNIEPGVVYPDTWYQGITSFDDAIWVIDGTGTYDNQKILDPISEGGEITDGFRLGVDSVNQYLYFLNKRTNILWQYSLSPTE